jgi:AGZA family xanthine/uracil permease-like MFS transporter
LNLTKRIGYRWAAIGDINSFFGLTLDNIAGLILIVGILVGFGVPADFVLRYMVPGTAIGVVVGDVLYTGMAFWLARKSGHADVTAMPLGLDTPSIFGIGIFVLGPSFLHAKNVLGMSELDAAQYMWQIGICCMLISGIFKTICGFGSKLARNSFPRAGLLGSLAAIALVIISFLPLLDILHQPIVGMVALALVLVSLLGKVSLPGRVPGMLAALAVAGTIHYGLTYLGVIITEVPFDASQGMFPTEWTTVFQGAWWNRMKDALPYIPIVLPFALATVIGGIDCAESAAAAGDHYPTGGIIAVEAVATLVAGLCGGVVQTTPYIGHPAYKSMGGRAAYTLATAMMMGAAGVIGFFGYFYQYVPAAAVYPILIFVGLEISAQSFLATPRRHYPAVAFACVPALAFLSVNFANQVLGDATVRTAVVRTESISQEASAPAPPNVSASNLSNRKLRDQLATANLLSSGFVLTSLLWSSGLALAIDRRLYASAICFMACSLMTLVGIIHSPLPGSALYFPCPLPGVSESLILPSTYRPPIYSMAIAYSLTAVVLAAWGSYLSSKGEYGPGDDIQGADI